MDTNQTPPTVLFWPFVAAALLMHCAPSSSMTPSAEDLGEEERAATTYPADCVGLAKYYGRAIPHNPWRVVGCADPQAMRFPYPGVRRAEIQPTNAQKMVIINADGRRFESAVVRDRQVFDTDDQFIKKFPLNTDMPPLIGSMVSGSGNTEFPVVKVFWLHDRAADGEAITVGEDNYNLGAAFSVYGEQTLSTGQDTVLLGAPKTFVALLQCTEESLAILAAERARVEFEFRRYGNERERLGRSGETGRWGNLANLDNYLNDIRDNLKEMERIDGECR